MSLSDMLQIRPGTTPQSWGDSSSQFQVSWCFTSRAIVLILILHRFSQLINVFKYVNWACFELNKMKGAFHYTKNVAFLILIRKYYRDWTEDRNVSARETLSTVRTQAINLRFWHRRNDKVPNYHIIGVQNRRIRYKNTNNPTRIISKHNHFNCQICSSPEDSCCAELLPLTRNVS